MKDPSKDFGVVLGSQACDVDSTVSAVAYAYFLEQVLRHNEFLTRASIILFLSDYNKAFVSSFPHL